MSCWLCLQFTESVAEMKGKLDTDVRLLPIEQMWRPRQYKPSESNAEYPTDITLFELCEEVQDMLKPLEECKDSTTFQKLWLHNGAIYRQKQERNRDRAEDGLTLGQIARKVWQPSKFSWDTLCTQLKDGSITFSRLDDFFKDINKK